MSIIKRKFNESNRLTLFNGDCSELLKSIPSNSVDLIITSPPYCIGKAYEDPHDDIKTFKKQHEDIFDDLYRVLKTGGSICWQVGYHVSDQCVIPLDYVVYNIFTSRSANFENPLILRNRIIWTFGHGLNSTKRFSGRHEMILWFTKGEQSVFNLDDVRVPQKYPGKKSIPQRLIKALTAPNGLILDPFMGSGTTGVAAYIENRRFIGAEILQAYYEIAVSRLEESINGTVKIREDKPVAKPNANTAVAKLPDEFAKARGEKV